MIKGFFIGNSLSDPKDLLIPYLVTSPANSLEARLWITSEIADKSRVTLPTRKACSCRVAPDEPLRVLECRCKTNGILPRWAECVAGEQPSEVDHFELVAQVLGVSLQA